MPNKDWPITATLLTDTYEDLDGLLLVANDKTIRGDGTDYDDTIVPSFPTSVPIPYSLITEPSPLSHEVLEIANTAIGRYDDAYASHRGYAVNS